MERIFAEMKKFFALVLALTMALSLVACGSKDDTRKLAGTWQYSMDLSEEMNQQMATALEMDDLQLDASFAIYMSLTVAEDGAYTMAVDMDATGAELNEYMQALAPVMSEAMYAAAEAEGMSREDFDAALVELGMTAEEYVAAILGAFDVSALLSAMAGTEDTMVSTGYCKAEDGKLYLAETADGLTGDAGYVNYTLSGDTMTWTDEEGELSSQLTQQEQELMSFPMVWTKQAAE